MLSPFYGESSVLVYRFKTHLPTEVSTSRHRRVQQDYGPQPFFGVVVPFPRCRRWPRAHRGFLGATGWTPLDRHLERRHLDGFLFFFFLGMLFLQGLFQGSPLGIFSCFTRFDAALFRDLGKAGGPENPLRPLEGECRTAMTTES